MILCKQMLTLRNGPGSNLIRFSGQSRINIKSTSLKPGRISKKDTKSNRREKGKQWSLKKSKVQLIWKEKPRTSYSNKKRRWLRWLSQTNHCLGRRWRNSWLSGETIIYTQPLVFGNKGQHNKPKHHKSCRVPYSKRCITNEVEMLFKHGEEIWWSCTSVRRSSQQLLKRKIIRFKKIK